MFSAADKGRTHVAELFEALIISSELEDGRILAARLGEHGITPTYCSPLDVEQIVLSRDSVRLVFCDTRLIKQVYPSLRRAGHSRQSRVLPVIFKCPGGAEGSLQIQGLEDVDFIAPPFEGDAIEQIIKKVIAREESPEEGH
jgi:DNA-binding NtrC family response regulator